jgi:uncharacterized Rmd1/YagE family protein
MLIRAVRVGQKINVRELQIQMKMNLIFREPFVAEYTKRKFIGIFRYGVVVFWGFNQEESDDFLEGIQPFIVEPFSRFEDEYVDVLTGKSSDRVAGNAIHIRSADVLKVALIFEVLARSSALEYFEKEIEKIMSEFEQVVQSFSKEGKTTLSTKELLKRVGTAMKIQHAAVGQMAMLDKPDLTWDSPSLDRFYRDLEQNYEIEDRYSIISQKLKMLFHNVEFILDFIEARRSLILEVIIVLLILIELLIFLFQTCVQKIAV